MKVDQDYLIRIAGAVSDGKAVNWEAEESAEPRLEGRLRKLRVLESIASFHQTPAEAEPRDAPGSIAEALDQLGDVSEAPTLGPLKTTAAPAGPVREWGHLKLLERLGEGASGEVFRATDPKLGRDVALKLLRTDVRMDPQRFLSEARRLARVRHANVLMVHGAAEHDGRVGLWTDLLAGETLERRLRREGRCGPEEAAGIGINLCEALAAVHGQGLVHRDVKTTNVMREEGGRIVLMDFSAAGEMPDDKERSGFEPVTGTPLFMAPEVLDGEEAGKAADIYSLGVVLYRLISGRFPIEAENLRDLRQAHRDGKALSLLDARPDTPPALARVVNKALSREPAGRYRTAGDMERDLAAASGRPVIETPRPRRTRRAILASAAAVVLLTGSLALWIWLFPGPLQVDASFYRVPAGDRFKEERLHPGGRVNAGDQVFLEIRSAARMHVYVLNEDEDGRVVVMFPLPSLDLANPLSPHAMHRLPGSVAGEPKYWDIGGARGRETFLVIASRSELTEFQASLGEARRADAGAAAVDMDRAEGAIRTILRGVTGISSATDDEASHATRRLFGLTRGLADKAASGEGVWMWMLELENAGP